MTFIAGDFALLVRVRVLAQAVADGGEGRVQHLRVRRRAVRDADVRADARADARAVSPADARPDCDARAVARADEHGADGLAVPDARA